jgi:hypothetical protein
MGSHQCLAPQFRQQFHLSATQTAFLVAVPVLLGALARLPIGMLADRFGGRSVFTKRRAEFDQIVNWRSPVPFFARQSSACARNAHAKRTESAPPRMSAFAMTHRIYPLSGLLGYYSLVSMTINAFEVPPPDGAPQPFVHEALPRRALAKQHEISVLLIGETVRRERRWTSAGATPARELVRSTR